MDRHTSTLTALGAIALFVGLPTRGHAQDEARLRRALEGKRVTLQIDMPATSAGVDLFPGTSRPLDFGKYAGRLKSAGTAYKQGETAIITKVRVKGDNIEIQLGGGGYGTFGDQLGGLFTNQGADSGAAQQAKIANERTQRLAAGSRFNLRFQNGVTPDDVTPDAVSRSLQEYATFAATPGAVAAKERAADQAAPPAGVAEAAAVENQPRKGMTADELERRWGKASSTVANGQITTNTYALASGAVEVDLFNGVAVDVRKRAAAPPNPIRKGMSIAEVEAVAGKPLSSNQPGPRAHGIVFSKDSKFAYVAELGLDRVYTYRVDTTKGTLAPFDPPFVTLKGGSGPRRLQLHPNGKFLYVNHETDSQVSVFEVNGGKLKEI